jgi:hypothetical protein
MRRARPARALTATLVVALVMATELQSGDASARPTRPRFEPTDLELEDPGVTEVDLQVGLTRGDGDSGNRLLLPDFELDIGLLPNVEFDLDGAFSMDRYDRSTRTFAGEPLWTAMKLGLYDSRDQAGTHAFAAGLQLGPRVPTIGQRGIGYAALGLFGIVDRRLRVTLNAGGVVDPGAQITHGQSKSLVGGVDLDVDLDARGIWSVLGELAASHYVSSDPDELVTTLGIDLAATPDLDLSTMVLVGLLPGSDRVAILLGASQKMALW